MNSSRKILPYYVGLILTALTLGSINLVTSQTTNSDALITSDWAGKLVNAFIGGIGSSSKIDRLEKILHRALLIMTDEKHYPGNFRATLRSDPLINSWLHGADASSVNDNSFTTSAATVKPLTTRPTTLPSTTTSKPRPSSISTTNKPSTLTGSTATSPTPPTSTTVSPAGWDWPEPLPCQPPFLPEEQTKILTLFGNNLTYSVVSKADKSVHLTDFSWRVAAVNQCWPGISVETITIYIYDMGDVAGTSPALGRQYGWNIAKFCFSHTPIPPRSSTTGIFSIRQDAVAECLDNMSKAVLKTCHRYKIELQPEFSVINKKGNVSTINIITPGCP